MKISIKNLESSTLELTVDGAVSSFPAGDSRDVDFSTSLSVERQLTPQEKAIQALTEQNQAAVQAALAGSAEAAKQTLSVRDSQELLSLQSGLLKSSGT